MDGILREIKLVMVHRDDDDDYTKIIPFSHWSVEAAEREFKSECRGALERNVYLFYFIGEEFYLFDHYNSQLELFTTPEFLTLEDWFEKYAPKNERKEKIKKIITD